MSSKNSRFIAYLLKNYTYISTVVLVFLIIFSCSYLGLDPDFGWHLQAGKYFILNGLPKTDIFSFTASGFNWISHEWVNDVVIASSYKLGGYLLTSLLFAAIWTSGLVLASRKKSSFVLILSAMAVMPFVGIRPVAWSVLIVAVLELIHDRASKKLYLAIPFIFLIWANLHGSFLFGLLLISLWQIFSKNKLPWYIFVASYLAVFINPYGWRIFIEIFATLLDTKIKGRISEWAPIMLPMVSVSYFVILAGLHFSLGKKPFRKLFSIPGLTFAMALSSIRHYPLFIATSIRYFEAYEKDFKNKVNLKKLNNPSIIILSSIASVLIIFSGYYGIKQFRDSARGFRSQPQEIVDYINKRPCSQNIFNSYNLGGYLIWKLPGYKYYIDGRMPSWREGLVDYFGNYEKVLNNDEYRIKEFDKYNISCVIISDIEAKNKKGRGTALLEKLGSEGWKIVQRSNGYYLVIKD